MFSNKHFDPVAGSRLYNEYLEHYRLAEEVGFDGIMLNEHHNAPFCMQAKCNVFASILAAATKRVKIVLLGNPLPLADNPVRLAEELSMIDMVSRGRLVSGFVRGGGQEQLATGVNPAYNRERFEEAHELIVKTWTQPGPFRWEGTHYQHRVVNPWAVPLQKPHPRVWIPGVLSKETIVWAAQPALSLHRASARPSTPPRRSGSSTTRWRPRPATPAGRSTAGISSASTSPTRKRRRMQNARQFMWMQGEFTGLAHPVWSSPSGYFSPSYRTAFVEYAVGRRPNPRGAAFEDQIRDQQIIAGTPKTVVPEAPASPRGDPPVDPRALGQRRLRQQRGQPHVHPPARRGSAARRARDGQGARALEPLRGQRAREPGLPVAGNPSGRRRLVS